ncbi:MAG: cytochrome b/b6 domain-containing protein [Desulfobaccales bacterium]
MMKQIGTVRTSEELDGFTIFLHFGLMLFGVFAWLTGDWAGDYKKLQPLGFTIHKMVGLGVALIIAARLYHGFGGPKPARFATWVPYSRERLRLVLEDILGLIKLKLPDRPPHQGLAGLWETFGLAVFTWMAGTGLSMFLFLTPGQKPRGFVHVIKELHELGEMLIPVFLVVHVAAVIVHALAGDHRWRKMFFLKG